MKRSWFIEFFALGILGAYVAPPARADDAPVELPLIKVVGSRLPSDENVMWGFYRMNLGVGGVFFGGGNGFSATPADQGQEGDNEDCASQTEHPVNIRTGNKIFSELDFETSGEMALALTRTYSKSLDFNGAFGRTWYSSLDYRMGFLRGDRPCLQEPGLGVRPGCDLANTQPISTVWVFRANGARYSYKPDADGVPGRWEDKKAESISWIDQLEDRWVLHTEEGGTETYDLLGNPLTILNRYGVGWTYHYAPGSDPLLLERIVHSSGRQLQLTWQNHRVRTIADPAGQVITYDYNGAGYLSGVTYPGGTGTRTYHYELPSQPSALTGVSFNGVRYSQYSYYSSGEDYGKVYESGLAGGMEKSTFVYGPALFNSSYTEVTNARGGLALRVRTG